MIKFLKVFLLTSFAMTTVIGGLTAAGVYGGVIGFVSVYILFMSAAASTMYCLWDKL